MNLSVVVPVYNVEKYLPTCIESILGQLYSDFELILVDDGSSDASGQICDEYAQLDKRIQVIHQDNGGVSSARNAGMEKATGKYIAFVDADDTICKDIYTTMVEEAEKTDAEYTICGINEFYKQKKTQILFSLPDRKVLNRDGVINKLLFSIFTDENIVNSPVNKLFRLDIIKNNNFRFPKRRRAEDWLFSIRYLEVAQSAIYINKSLYCYIRNEQSAMSRVFPEQYILWKENLQIRREIAERYKLEVDWGAVNKRFVANVIPWSMAMRKQDKAFSFNTAFEDKEFVEACNNSYPLDGFRIEIVRRMISASLLPIARLLCEV